MNIDENTKILARLHPEKNNRGLSIYNPYFEKTDTNAKYLLFSDKNPQKLLEGMRNLNIAGAIPAGFEKDPRLINLVDELSPQAKAVGKVGLIKNIKGKLVGLHQAGYGLSKAIETHTDPNEKDVVILGAGNVAKALLHYWRLNNIQPKSLQIYNRTTSNIDSVKDEFNIDKSGSLDELILAQGDIFINTTYIGSPWNSGEDYIFGENFIKQFKLIVDVTFVPLRSQLIQIAESCGIETSPGWEMFLHQGTMCLEKTLDIEVDRGILAKLIKTDFETNWS